MERSQWRALFPRRILERGEDYCRRGVVRDLRQEEGSYRATVLGHDYYRVELIFSGQLIEEWACDCPYGRNGTPCKHLAAMFLALEQADWSAPDGLAALPLEDLIARLDEERLRMLVLRHARRDKALADELRALAEGCPDEKDSL